MDKKLKSRVARLEKLLSSKSVKNESVDNQDSCLHKVMCSLRGDAAFGVRLVGLLLSDEMANKDNF